MDLSLPSSSQESTDSNSSVDGDGQEVAKKLNNCKLCDYVTNRRSNLVRHLYTMHQTNMDQQGLECCDIRFLSKSHLKEHKKDFHADGYECKTCNRKFCRRALLKRHMNVHSGRKEFCCGRCAYATSHKSNLDRHYQRLHGLDCSNKGKVFVSVSMFEQSVTSDEFESSCEENGQFKNGNKPRLCSNLYQCFSCDRAFHSQTEQSLHAELCEISVETSMDESELRAALTLAQLKYGPSFNSTVRIPSA